MLPGVSRRIPGNPSERALHLTFDDGPDPAVTPAVLDLLEEFSARATFFLIGAKAVEHRALAAQIVARGHVIGNHAFSHRKLTDLSWTEQLQEVIKTEEALTSIDGRHTHPFRPPYGMASFALIARLRLRGMQTMYWSVDSQDFRHDSAASSRRLAAEKLRSGDVVLMHDDHVTAVDLLRRCLPEWAAAGFRHPAASSSKLPHD
jgi:peptidoglycan/xylan/chitin deacetylase (PgdA/CDA1 family)